MTESDELMGDLPNSYHTGSGSSYTGQAKLGAEKVNPAPITPPSTVEGSEESNDLEGEEHRHCVSSAEQGPVSMVYGHGAEQVPGSPQVEDVNKPTVANMPSLAPALPKTQIPELREAHEDAFSRSELESERQTLE